MDCLGTSQLGRGGAERGSLARHPVPHSLIATTSQKIRVKGANFQLLGALGIANFAANERCPFFFQLGVREMHLAVKPHSTSGSLCLVVQGSSRLTRAPEQPVRVPSAPGPKGEPGQKTTGLSLTDMKTAPFLPELPLKEARSQVAEVG